MRLWPVWLAGGLLLAAVVGAVGLFVGDDWKFRRDQKAYEAQPLIFEGAAQLDSTGSFKMRFDCPGRPDGEPITVKTLDVGVPNEAGRPYANETNELILGPVYVAGASGEIVDVPAIGFDRRVRPLLVSGRFGAEIYVAGPGGLAAIARVDQAEMNGVIGVRCGAR